jgi:hypothetical protein
MTGSDLLGGRIRQLPNRSKRYEATYVWPPNTDARHNALTTFSTRALAEQWLADERRPVVATAQPCRP